MPEPGVFVIAFGGVCVALLAPLEIAFGAVLAAWMLVPGSLVLPGSLHQVLLVDRIILWGFLLRLVLRSGRPREPAASAYRLTPLHLAVGAVVITGLSVGVLTAPPHSLHGNVDQWLRSLDLLVLFVSALAVVRTIGLDRVVRLIVLVTAVAVGIGILERITGRGWAHYLSEHIPPAYLNVGVNPLLVRGGAVRVQGAAQFALEFGWVLVMLLPIVTIAVLAWTARFRGLGNWRKALGVLPVAAAVCVLLTASRSAEVAVAGAAILLVILAGAPRRLTLGVGAALVIVVLLVLLSPAVLSSPFTAAARTTSATVRFQHIPAVLALAAHHPFTGLGNTGLSAAFGGTDDSYILLYGEQGMVGVLAWGVLLLTSLATACRALRAPRNSQVRNLASAVVVGVIAVAVAGSTYDLVGAFESPWTLILLGALAVALAEQVPRPLTRRRWGLRLMLPVTGCLAGVAVFLVSPAGSSQVVSVFSVTPRIQAGSDAPNFFLANTLDSTICGALQQPNRILPGTEIRCEIPSAIQHDTWQSRVDIRIGGPTPRAVEEGERFDLAPLVGSSHTFVVADDGPIATGKPVGSVTAPLTGAVAGSMAMLLAPPLRRHRRSEVPRSESSTT